MDYLPRTIDGQLYFHYTQLRNWDKNEDTRILTRDNATKLHDELVLNGVEDAFKIGDDGTVYDGNNRLKMTRQLIEKEGIKTAHNGQSLAWIPVTVKHPTSEADKWGYAMKRNSQYANWNQDTLFNYQDEWEELETANINIDFGTHKSVDEQLTDLEKETQTAIPDQEEATVTCPSCGHEFTP